MNTKIDNRFPQGSPESASLLHQHRQIDQTIFAPKDCWVQLCIIANMTADCTFCTIAPERIVAETPLTFTIRDGFPISPGHTLIISKRHFCSFFEATPEEERELMQALHDAKSQLDFEFSPMGYNIGINDGSAAGQTIPHLHIHLIPRYEGDVIDPRGGVRWIIPE